MPPNNFKKFLWLTKFRAFFKVKNTFFNILFEIDVFILILNNIKNITITPLNCKKITSEAAEVEK
jgi:hypothetical protein